MPSLPRRDVQRLGVLLAVGLILGDYPTAVIWAGVGLATGTATYSVFWA